MSVLDGPMDLDKVRYAVSLAARCKSIEFDRQMPVGQQWVARMWCNAKGEIVYGVGDDEWTAVQAVHAVCAMYERGR
jgi:hypothetical protein